MMWSGGTQTELGGLGGRNSYANGINDVGSVVGSADTSGSGGVPTIQHAVEWAGTVAVDL